MKVENAVKNKILNRLNSIEFVVSEKCQNACKYCYRVKKHNSSTVNYINPENAYIYLDNFCEIFNVDKDYFKTLGLELFGGDALVDYVKFKRLLEICMNDYEFKHMVIPTNSRLLNELNSYDILELLNIGKRLAFSLSVDGAPADCQRPLSKYGRMLSYEEKINYDRLINLSKKHSFGFHPMFSFDNFDIWYDTFIFFAEQEVYPYLLEVRHPIDNESALQCVLQLKRIRQYVDTLDKPFLRKQLNTIYSSRVPRGLGCSAHTTFTIMPNGDVPFCHRVVDPPWVSLNILTKEWDTSKHITLISGHHHSNHPVCMVCPVRSVCTGQCAGASYEYWGDPWIPINSICNYILLKYYVFIKLFGDWKANANHINIKELEQKVFNIFGENKVKEILND
jgi:radical SAM protein with 4Fe4S-binding SPASM domain